MYVELCCFVYVFVILYFDHIVYITTYKHCIGEGKQYALFLGFLY